MAKRNFDDPTAVRERSGDEKEDPKPIAACGNCRFYIEQFCHEGPPQVVSALHTAWPSVSATDWCGEWEARGNA